jgi:FAD/FMN-containing dehydrogenase
MEEQLQQWKIRESVSTLLANNEGLLHSLPLFDGIVPVDRVRELMEGVYKILSSNNLKIGVWGRIGDGCLQFRPSLNLGHVGDRQKIFRLLDEYHRLVLDLNGSISSSDGDGRLRTPYLEKMYGHELYGLLQKVKQIFDPYETLNPGVKFDTNIDDLKAIIRPDYGIHHLYDHLPRD